MSYVVFITSEMFRRQAISQLLDRILSLKQSKSAILKQTQNGYIPANFGIK